MRTLIKKASTTAVEAGTRQEAEAQCIDPAGEPFCRRFKLSVGTKNLADETSRLVMDVCLCKNAYATMEALLDTDPSSALALRKRARELAAISTDQVAHRLNTIASFIGIELGIELSTKDNRRRARRKRDKERQEERAERERQQEEARLARVAALEQATPTQSYLEACASDPETPSPHPVAAATAASSDQPHPEVSVQHSPSSLPGFPQVAVQ